MKRKKQPDSSPIIGKVIIEHGAPFEEWTRKFIGRKLLRFHSQANGLVLDFGDGLGLLVEAPFVLREAVQTEAQRKQ
jgi:hypothetical protein